MGGTQSWLFHKPVITSKLTANFNDYSQLLKYISHQKSSHWRIVMHNTIPIAQLCMKDRHDTARSLSYEFRQTQSTSAAMFPPSGSNGYLFPEYPSHSRSLSYLGFQQRNKSQKWNSSLWPPWHSCLLKYFLRHRLEIWSFWPRARWRHF